MIKGTLIFLLIFIFSKLCHYFLKDMMENIPDENEGFEFA